MKITDASVYSFELPLVRPTTAGGGAVRRGLLLELTDDSGVVGWGEASPLPGVSAESLDEASANLVAVCDALKKGETTSEMLPSVRFAVESAMSDISGDNAPAENPFIPLNALVDLSSGSVERQVSEALDLEFTTLKLKVGRGDPSGELWLIENVRRLAGPDVSIRLDANRSWSFEEAQDFLGKVSRQDIEYIEEPLSDATDLPRLIGSCDIGIALDETLSEIEPEGLREYAGAAAIVIKPTILGGVARAVAWSESARGHGISPVISAAFESGVGIRHLAHLAARSMEEGVAAGLDTYRWLTNDVLAKALRTSRGCIETGGLSKFKVRKEMLTRISDG
ncbi:MAG: o-succinylbenzoate synthase [Verrucomicrobia bacterium]|nr:o-succinylbenzoate synthase [Verrucomicrobiota bacterium]